MYRLSLAILLGAALPAQNLGGGAVAPNGKVVQFDLEHWTPGVASRFLFTGAPATTRTFVLAISTASVAVALPGFHGTLRADVLSGRGFYLFGAASTPVTLPASIGGTSLVIQGCVIDQNGQGYFTDATRIDLFQPIVLVGNSRQSSNSIQSIDLVRRSVLQRLGNSELGHITFSVDRRYAYVTEPGSGRNRVVAYDLSGPSIVARAFINVTGGIRYRCAQPRSGKVLYVPVHNGVSVIDTDPASATFHKELRVIAVPITGSSGAIFTGPMAVQLDVTESKLYVAYGESLTHPAPSTLGVIDLTLPNFPHRAIRLTTGGSFFGLASRLDMVRSPDGVHMYVLEWGVQPSLPFVVGFAQGGMLSVVDTLTDREVKAIPTGGYAAQELAADRLGRSLWIPQITAANRGQLLRIDVDPRSTARFTIRSAIQVGSGTYQASASGPMGIDTTPDSSTVCFTVTEGQGQQFPELWTLDARTERLFGSPIRVESLPGTLSISQF